MTPYFRLISRLKSTADAEGLSPSEQLKLHHLQTASRPVMPLCWCGFWVLSLRIKIVFTCMCMNFNIVSRLFQNHMKEYWRQCKSKRITLPHALLWLGKVGGITISNLTKLCLMKPYNPGEKIFKKSK